MRVETTSSGYIYDLPTNTPTKRFREDARTVPLAKRRRGEYFYVRLPDGRTNIHAMMIDSAPAPMPEGDP